MNLFGLEGSGFIISLGITLLLSGLIMYYCVQRINSLEQSLVKQGEIIQTFIYKLNNLELQNNSIPHQSNLETNTNTNNNKFPKNCKLLYLVDDWIFLFFMLCFLIAI